MKKWKKLVTGITMTALLIGALGGCGSEESSSNRTGTKDSDKVVRIQVSKDTVCGVAMQMAAEKL